MQASVAEAVVQEHEAQVGRWQEELAALHARIGGRFRRVEVRARVGRYLQALLGRVQRKNSWQLAEEAGEATPDGMQQLLSTARWDVDGVRDDLRSYVVEQVGDPQAVLVLDESGLLKKGCHSVGVKRQYSGAAGRVENSQVGVFLAYASLRGRAFLDRELYLPAEWAADPARRAAAGVPEAVGFATKPALGRAMLERTFAAGVPAAWVTADEVYGNDGQLRGWLADQERAYVLAVSRAHSLWLVDTTGAVVPVWADDLVAALPARAWVRLSAGDGSKGPRLYDWACVHLPLACAPGWSKWLLARRSLSDPTEVAYYRAFGPADTALPELVRVAGTRWIIEETIERAKGEVGLAQYQVRRWAGWYRFVTLALLAHAFLEVTRAQEAASAPVAEGLQKGGLLCA